MSLSFFPSQTYGAEPGLPFTENFNATDLRDAPRTTANWSTDEGALLMAFRRAQFGAFDPDITSGTDISGDTDQTLAVAVGDVNGDGFPDLIAGNSGQRNRLYLNNGTSSPFSGVTGSDISTDMNNVRGIALGDVDRDGDLDLVTVSNFATNRLYLNNGTPDPFAGVAGTDITAVVISAAAAALGDLDADGDLDLVVGKSGRNLLYFNNGTADPFAAAVPVDLTTDASATTSVALGDIDGDGDLDVVTGNFNQPNRVYLNNGTADPFEGVAGSDIASDTQATRAVALGDMDGDGDLDLVAGNHERPNRLYLNNGTGAPFEGVVGSDISTGFQTFGVAIGDVDCDGDLDVVAITSDNRNRLFLNNGTPAPFEGATANSITTDQTLRRAGALADMDLDGDLDLVVGTLNVPNRLYLNNGNANPWSATAGKDITGDVASTIALTAGDVDGDGDLDVVVGNQGLPGERNRLYLNNGTSDPFDGVMGSDITNDEFSTNAVVLGDVDRDGDLDMLTGNSGLLGDQRNRLYLNNGTSNPFNGAMGSDITNDEHATFDLALGDMDGDGDLDLIAGNGNTPPRFYRNNGSPNPFSGAVGTDITTDLQGADSVALGDVDSDGDTDLVYGRFFERTTLVLNNGTSDPFAGALGQKIDSDSPATHSVALGDINGDGRLDLVVGIENDRIRLYLNNGTSDPFEGDSVRHISTDEGETRSVALGDVDLDGDLDVVAGNASEPNRLFLNNGTADPFEGVEGADITDDASETHSVMLADIDGNGSLDLLTGNFKEPNRLYLNTATPKPVTGWRGSDVSDDTHLDPSIALGDLDNDGDLDVLVGTSFGPNKIYFNDGRSRLFLDASGFNVSDDGDQTLDVALGDVDGDGDLDAVAGNNGSPSRLYLNNGTSNPFNGVVGSDITADASDTHAVALGDLDGDGDLDLAVGNGDDQLNRLYLNNGTSQPFSGVVGSDITESNAIVSDIALGDINGDGHLDIVTSTSNSRNGLYLNNGTSAPFDGIPGRTVTSEISNSTSLALGDVDGDGDLDVAVGNLIVPNRLFLHNGTDNPFVGVMGQNITGDVLSTRAVALKDVDSDGDLDFLAGNFDGPNRLYLNNGTATPFAGVTGIDITSEVNVTHDLALGDLDLDGCIDVVAADESSPKRLYRRILANTARGRAASLAVDTESLNIFEAVLEVTETLPINTGIDYWLSNNGGLKSYLVTPGELFMFPTTGSDLRWRAELKSLSPFLTPRLETLSLQLGRDLVVEPTSVNFMEHPIGSGPSQSATLTLTNRGAADLSFSGFGIVGFDFGDFVVTDLTVGTILSPGASGTASVAFEPNSLGPKTAAFQISSDDPAEPIVQIPLAGVGIEPPTPTETETPSSTPTPSQTTIFSPTGTPTLTPTPTVDLLATPSDTATQGPSPTPSDTPIEGPSPTPSETPTPGGPAEFDIHPDIPNGLIDAGDLLRWFERLQGTGNDRSLLFDFARFWETAYD